MALLGEDATPQVSVREVVSQRRVTLVVRRRVLVRLQGGVGVRAAAKASSPAEPARARRSPGVQARTSGPRPAGRARSLSSPIDSDIFFPVA